MMFKSHAFTMLLRCWEFGLRLHCLKITYGLWVTQIAGYSCKPTVAGSPCVGQVSRTFYVTFQIFIIYFPGHKNPEKLIGERRIWLSVKQKDSDTAFLSVSFISQTWKAVLCFLTLVWSHFWSKELISSVSLFTLMSCPGVSVEILF